MIRHANRPVVVRRLAGLLTAVIALAACSASTPARAADATESPESGIARHPATIAALAWMEIVSNGEYAKSWAEAGEIFRTAVTSEKWSQIALQVRAPLGKCAGRIPARYTEQLEVPTPDGRKLSGEFAVIRFKSVFEKLPQAIETVSMQKEIDGKWKVIGYYIKAEN